MEILTNNQISDKYNLSVINVKNYKYNYKRYGRKSITRKDELDIIANNAIKYQENLQYSFAISAKVLDKSVDKISNIYYNTVRKKYNILSVASKHNGTPNNIKNNKRKDGVYQEIEKPTLDVIIANLLGLGLSSKEYKMIALAIS